MVKSMAFFSFVPMGSYKWPSLFILISTRPPATSKAAAPLATRHHHPTPLHHQLLLLLLFFMAASSSAATAGYSPSTRESWKDVPNARRSQQLSDAANFAVADYNESSGTKLEFVEVLEGQELATLRVGTRTYQLVIGARTSARLYKVYKCVVSQVSGSNSKERKSFEPILP
ncbi:hypothetical protein EJ110_NYTH40887 [Nymphaea thermarum]|nr:hypothetical protein EJ110_NYTH40887 [Nymphaea thermarum]